VDGGLAYGCTQSFQVESAVTGGPCSPNEALCCEATRGEGSRRRRKAESRQAGCATPRRIMPVCDARKSHRGTCGEARKRIHRVTGAQSPSERAEEEQRISCRTKALSTGKHLVASRRRGRSGLGEPLRIGPRAPRKCTRRYRGRIATGASEAGRRVPGKAEKAPACEDGPPKRSSRVVKRADLRS
jgi:hypothetical protein